MNWKYLVSELNVSSILIGASPLVFGLILRTILEIKAWPWLIWMFNWIPVRSIFRENPPNLRGEWDVYWESNSSAFSDEKDRHKTAKIYQFNEFCYADYAAKDQRYCMIGKIEGIYITGTWYNKRDKYGYRGAFQLRIEDSKKLSGRWVGFSNTKTEINTDLYTWTKNPD